MSITDVARSAANAMHNVVSTVANKVANKVANATSDAKAQAQANSQVSNTSTDENNGAELAAAKDDDGVDLSETAEKLTQEAKSYKSEEEALNAAMDEDGIDEKTTNINGTDGNDTIDITINKDGSYTVVVNGEEHSYTAEEAQRLVVDGGKGNDTINVHQDGYQNGSYKDENGVEHKTGLMIKGGDGNDAIKADDNVRRSLYISGGNGNDTIVGGNATDHIVDNYGSNTINGGAGNDSITALGYDDTDTWYARLWNKLAGNSNQSNTIEGGLGNDTIITGDGDDSITDKGGSNTVISNGGNDSIELTGSTRWSTNNVHAGDGNDSVKTGEGNDTIYGGDGKDVIESTGGENNLHGGDGNDIIYGGESRDYIEGGHGNDIIYGRGAGDVIYSGKGDDIVYGGEGDDFINAGKGDDIVYGGDGNDTMFGLEGNDKLYGGDGNDVIASGKGKDLVYGGDGADTIRYTQGFFTGDEVHSDSEDDVKMLKPIDVPNNFKMDKSTPEWFQENMRDNLEAFASIEPGQELLRGIANTGRTVTFTYTNDHNGYAAQIGSGGSANVQYADDGSVTGWSASSGCNSVVKINPEFITLYSGSQPWSDCNTMVIMAHEMCHAYNNATGTMDYTTFYNNDTLDTEGNVEGSRSIRGAELQAVGIGPSVVGANPYGMAENDFREYFNMEKRTSYLAQ